MYINQMTMLLGTRSYFTQGQGGLSLHRTFYTAISISKDHRYRDAGAA